MYLYIYVHTYTYMYTYICICIYIYMYTHTHTCTHTYMCRYVNRNEWQFGTAVRNTQWQQTTPDNCKNKRISGQKRHELGFRGGNV